MIESGLVHRRGFDLDILKYPTLPGVSSLIVPAVCCVRQQIPFPYVSFGPCRIQYVMKKMGSFRIFFTRTMLFLWKKCRNPAHSAVGGIRGNFDLQIYCSFDELKVFEKGQGSAFL